MILCEKAPSYNLSTYSHASRSGSSKGGVYCMPLFVQTHEFESELSRMDTVNSAKPLPHVFPVLSLTRQTT